MGWIIVIIERWACLLRERPVTEKWKAVAVRLW